MSIGELRNDAIAFAPEQEIIIHWDDDDWSHPRRIADQIAEFYIAGIDATGYQNMLFWREAEREAWLYDAKTSDDVLGTSLCYRRTAWERNPFDHINNGEDTRFTHRMRLIRRDGVNLREPRMIARIHKGNENKLPYRRELMLASANQGGEWTRVPQWDDYCRKIMK